MLNVRKSLDRGHANHGWLDTYHTFSFASYYDSANMGFRALRVINEDRVEAGEGFPTHPHRDMEILTLMLDGELAHRDSMGNGRVIKRGEVQGMSAGTGITHSEFNASHSNPVHLLQIWIMPHTQGVKPSYGDWVQPNDNQKGWNLVASEDGAAGSIRIHQDAKVYLARPGKGESLDIPIPKGRYGWLQVAKGNVQLGGEALQAGDGASFNAGDATSIKMDSEGELLLFDLA